MTFTRAVQVAAFAIAFQALTIAAPLPGISFIGKGTVSGSGTDLSGLTGKICRAGADPTVAGNCVSKAILGGFGSDMTYTGSDNVFLAAPDRGPFDGVTDVPYLNRFHFFHIDLDTEKPFPNITLTLLDTRFFKNEVANTFLGGTGEFNVNNALETLRFDPEGIRVSRQGTFFVSDEYGPYLFEFDRQGHILRRMPVPPKFLIANPNANPVAELTGNTSGRQANRGMEGLAITPDGHTLVGIMQSSLIQDNGLDLSTPALDDRLGIVNRILTMDAATGATKEYVYVMDAVNRGQGVSEILAVNDHQFLVVERDNRSFLKPGDSQAPTRKNIYLIDLNGATDVSGVASLPAAGGASLTNLGITPVSKSLFINLLEPVFGLVPTIAEKIEALAWGEDLEDGTHVLYVVSDNDLDPTLATQIYAFGVDAETMGLDVQTQILHGPLFPPGQVKKIVGGKDKKK